MKFLFFSFLIFYLVTPLLAADRVESGGLRDFNVVIIDFDTFRADRLGSLGYARRLTPNLDTLAASSYLFTNAVSQSAWTLPSTMSFFTSLYPHQHSVVNKFAVFLEGRKQPARLPRRFSSLAQLFRRNGYRTAAFTGDAGVAGHFGFGSGFEVYFDSVSFGGFGTTFPLALDWIEDRQTEKFFIFIHGYDVHGQFPLPADFSSRFSSANYHGPFFGSQKEFLDLRMKTIRGRDIRITAADADFWKAWYDDKIFLADERFGRFWKRLSSLPSVKRTILVVMSDHGEEFYEHGGFDHGMTLYDEIIRVPLIIHVPQASGSRIDAQVRLIDVMPTLADLLGLRLDENTRRQMQGVSLLPLMRGQALSLDAFSETSFLLQTEKRALRTSAGWKLIYDLGRLSPELYDLRFDPGEKNNLAGKETGLVETLTRRLSEWSESPAPKLHD